MSQECALGRQRALESFQAQLNIMRDNRDGVAQHKVMPIHDMRVASRRLRMALKIYREYIPKKAKKALNRELRKITRALGRRRELDVMVAMLRAHRDETHALWKRFMDHAIGILEQRQAREVRSCDAAITVLESETFLAANGSVVDGLDTHSGCVLDVAREELLAAFDFTRDARKWWKRNGDDDDLHEVRIAIKKFRYACEFHNDLFGPPMAAHIARLKETQSCLGEWNECRLLEDMVLILGDAADYQIAQGAPLVAEAYGQRADALEIQFKAQGKAQFSLDARKAFALLLESPVVSCCASK